jgi:intracellular multiplication protein IcmV
MRIFTGLKKAIKPLVNFPVWMGYQTLAESGKAILRDAKDLFVPPESGKPETFEEATNRLQLTPEKIASREKAFFLLTWFWGIITLCALLYTIWLIFNDGLTGALLGIALTFLGSVLTFRYHFWYFQVKHRLLGATFKQWLHATLGKTSWN